MGLYELLLGKIEKKITPLTEEEIEEQKEGKLPPIHGTKNMATILKGGA